MICLVLTGATIRENLARTAEYRRRIDQVELRADFLSDDELQGISAFPSLVDLPAILTVRKPEDGGRFSGDERSRLSLLKRGLGGRIPYARVDLEGGLPSLPEIENLCAERGTSIIRSFHDFRGIPDDFERRLGSLARTAREIPKAAVMIGSASDLVRLHAAGSSRKEGIGGSGLILVGMGPAGVPSRILSARFGSLFTYASPSDRSAAPGHLDPETLEETYRFRSLGRDTKLFGIIGNPVMHTRSPGIHNPAFTRLGIDAVYIPFQLRTIGELAPLTETFDLRGLSVTVPFKEAVVPLLSSAEEAVRRTGACNTVIRVRDGWSGYNTDIEGFLAPLLDRGIVLRGLRVLVIGAGGAARSAVYALTAAGARVLVLNRTTERARMLAAEFGCDWGGLDADGFAKAGASCGLVVQTTSSGMSPHEGEDPSEGYRFTGNETAYDLVYKPAVTRFLARAAEAGCETVGGDEMLLAQAYRQFLLFTGLPYPGRER